MAVEDKGGVGRRTNELSEGDHEPSSRCNPKLVVAHKAPEVICRQ
jgi:hypothetical protein